VFILSKPTTKAVITASVRAARSLTRRIAHAHEVQNQLRTKLEDIKLLNRAKSCLISYLGMTEPQAHRYIQKHAMDARITPREVSEEILKTYEY
ncbi:MAG: ANTAR domain-containing response regulator, partial [Christensenellaceae bacterium]|jgi:AmiR/NasT family two-component response regulator